jgi:hypothetical protein
VTEADLVTCLVTRDFQDRFGHVRLKGQRVEYARRDVDDLEARGWVTEDRPPKRETEIPPARPGLYLVLLAFRPDKYAPTEHLHAPDEVVYLHGERAREFVAAGFVRRLRPDELRDLLAEDGA